VAADYWPTLFDTLTHMSNDLSKTHEMQGRCLCGAVSIVARTASKTVGACHCKMCRRWSGGPLFAVDCGVEASIEGEDKINVFDSSEWADRGFCSRCGTHLFYRLKQTGQLMVPAGLFDDDSRLEFEHQVFIDEKPGYYTFANKTHDMTGAEVFALYGAD